jgi:hypothetical protein
MTKPSLRTEIATTSDCLSNPSRSNLSTTLAALLVIGQGIGQVIKVKKPLYLQVVKVKPGTIFEPAGVCNFGGKLYLGRLGC